MTEMKNERINMPTFDCADYNIWLQAGAIYNKLFTLARTVSSFLQLCCFSRHGATHQGKIGPVDTAALCSAVTWPPRLRSANFIPYIYGNHETSYTKPI